MIEATRNIDRQGFVTDLSTLIRQRINEATPIDLLSSSDDKKVELVRDTTGHQFVRRTYSQEALDFIERSGLSYEEALVALQRDFSRAGLEITPHFVVNPKKAAGEPLVVVSQFLEDALPVTDASTETKAVLARGLGNLLVRGEEVLPQQQMLREDMFHVIQTPNGGEAAMLTDLDPYVIPVDTFYSRSAFKDLMSAAYINRVASLFYDDWTRPDERYQVLGAFVTGLGPIFHTDPGMVTLKAFGDVNMMKQGLDPR